MIYEISQVTGTHESILGFTDMINFTPRREMMSKDLILSIQETPQDIFWKICIK